MAEERVVRFSKRGQVTLWEIIEYFDEHSLKAGDHFLEKVTLRLEVLKKYPESGLKSLKRKGIRSVQIDKRRRLYYRYSDDEIIVIFFWDSKMVPTKNPF